LSIPAEGFERDLHFRVVSSARRQLSFLGLEIIVLGGFPLENDPFNRNDSLDRHQHVSRKFGEGSTVIWRFAGFLDQ